MNVLTMMSITTHHSQITTHKQMLLSFHLLTLNNN